MRDEAEARIEQLIDAGGSDDSPDASADDPDGGALFRRFTHAFLAGAGDRAFRTHADRGLWTLSRTAFEFGRTRRPGEQSIRLSSPSELPGRSVLEIHQEDRPFLVDTVRLFLRRHHLKEQLLLHPTLTARRNAEGVLEEIAADGGANETDGEAKKSSAVQESFIYVEIFPQLDEARIQELTTELREVMNWVANVTSDHSRMIRAVRGIEANIEFAGRDLGLPPDRVAKLRRFLDWLVEDNFVLLGVRQYDVTYDVKSKDNEVAVAIRPGKGLGMWRTEHASRFKDVQRGAELPAGLSRSLADPRIIQISKGWVESRIHRAGRMDRILVKEHGESGRVSGFHIISGLFTYKALRTPSSQLPLLSERLEEILGAEKATVGSHRQKAIVSAFDSAPMEFLLGTDVEHNTLLIHEIVEAEGTEEPRVVLQTDAGGRSFYAAVIMPRERYGEALRRDIRRQFERTASIGHIDDRVSFLEEGTALIHFFCTLTSGEAPQADALEIEVRRMAASWDDGLTDELVRRHGPAEGGELSARYVDAFPEGLHVTTHPADAVRDVTGLERLFRSGEPQIALFFDRAATSDTTTMLRLYLPEDRLLSDLLPLVDHFGIRVSDARQTRIAALDRPSAFLHAFRVLPLGGIQADLDELAPRLGDALRAVLGGVVPSDILNSLVLGAGFDWRQVDLLRSYIEYYNQIQVGLTRRFMCDVLLQNPIAARLLIAYHEVRLGLGLTEDERRDREVDLATRFARYRDRVDSLNEDRALGALFELIDATLRTNFFAPLEGPHRIATKLDPARLADVRPPYPYREIFVHGPGVGGIHLRGGPVARGGLRWSDRLDDFRTEVLGLMRTQQLKNGLIVPVGAKGGFVLRTMGLSPQEARAEADAKYQIFISALLDVTDNLDAEGRVLPPAGVFRRDGDDPYLVVAADKGTAHLSDTANAIAKRRNFWLGDAFASGGSVGYDHKKYAITARGTWECVRHHFFELGIDPDRDAYSVVGIGDMSGDVFGNGLLLMPRAHLVAAFDHRHIFLDPDPDPQIAWQERQRLFDLPRSCWIDYDASLISKGGGVFGRSAKRIELSPEIRARLGLEVDVEVVTGPELVRAILAAPIDLLWNGGIGTYVKASHQSHLDAGDRSNDAVRIDASALRARVIGEGGNLGFTQAARVEAALAGVHLDSDAIHNSAGVDLSDHEVNFKILLAPLVQSGALDEATRSQRLFEVVDAACESVLSHNRAQALSISLDEMRSRIDLDSFRSAIDLLCDAQNVSREEVGLPNDAVLDQRRSEGVGLTRPELAVLLGLAKLHLRLSLAEDAFVDSADVTPLYRGYFPVALREAFGEAVASHRLRRQVTALAIANRIIDNGGVCAISNLVAKRGLDVPTAAAAWLTADDILDADHHRASLLELKGQVDFTAIDGALLELDDAIRDVAHYLIAEDMTRLSEPRRQIWRKGLFALSNHVADFLTGAEQDRFTNRLTRLIESGIPETIANVLAGGPLADRGFNIIRLVEDTDRSPLEMAVAYARLGEASGINWVYQSLPLAHATDVWDRIVLMDLRTGMLTLQRELTAQAVARQPGDALVAVDAFLAEHSATIARVRALEPETPAAPTASALAVVTQTLMRLRSAPDPVGE